MPIRVLHFAFGFDVGGIESMLMNLYRRIDRTKVQFDFYTFSSVSQYEDEIRSLGGSVYHARTSGNGFNPWEYLPEIKAFLKNRSYNVVHIHAGPLMVSRYTVSLCSKMKIPMIILHSHSTRPINTVRTRILNNLYLFFYGDRSTCRLSCSDMAGKSMFAERSYLFYKNGIDCARFGFNHDVRQQTRQNFCIPETAWVIGHVGRFDRIQKNQSFLIDIFSAFKRIHPQSFFLLVGDGDTKVEIEAKAKRLGLMDSIRFVGNRSDTENFYSAMDCFVLPSFFEGLPVVGVEAQASGLPCLFADTVTRETQVLSNVCFLSLSDAPHVWAEKCLELIKSNVDREKGLFEVKMAEWDLSETVPKLEVFYLSSGH